MPTTVMFINENNNLLEITNQLFYTILYLRSINIFIYTDLTICTISQSFNT